MTEERKIKDPSDMGAENQELLNQKLAAMRDRSMNATQSDPVPEEPPTPEEQAAASRWKRTTLELFMPDGDGRTPFEKAQQSFLTDGKLKTHFASLDSKALGLFPGLYLLGALSGLGKTTFALQMATQMAEHGKRILYIAYEQGEFELVSKTLARLTAKSMGGDKVFDSPTSLQIRQKAADCQPATEYYKAHIAENLTIVEGESGDTLEEVVRRIGTMEERKPQAVFIDYLQIVPQSAASETSIKQHMDNAATGLSRLARSMKIPIIVISSLNRQNYMTAINMEAFKESGGLDYSATVIWGLQLQAVHWEDFKDNGDNTSGRAERNRIISAATAQRVRHLELICLKSRYVGPGYSQAFRYYPHCDLYEEEADYWNGGGYQEEHGIIFPPGTGSKSGKRR